MTTRSPQRFIYTILGVAMMIATLYTFIDPALCAKGCGNLTEPVFVFLYFMLGSWGPRVVLFLAAILFFWAAASVRE